MQNLDHIKKAIDENKKHLTRIGTEWGGFHVDMKLITENSTVISGGIAGDISADKALIKEKGCYVIGVDPTAAALRTKIKYTIRHFFKRKKFKLLRKAIHGKSGLTIHLGGPAMTLLSPFGEKATTIALEDLIYMYQGASVLKLDIEGAEFPALEALSIKLRTPQIVIGFHIWLNGESDQWPNKGVVRSIHTPQDVLQVVQKIKEMGYKLVYQEKTDEDRIGQEVLFIRNDFATKYQDTDLIA